MATNTAICDIDASVKEKLKKFRFSKDKTNAAIVLKIKKDAMMIVEDDNFEDDELEDISPDDLGEALPEIVPRYVVYRYCHDHGGGRISYPLCLIYCAPTGCTNRPLQMMYAGSRNSLVTEGNFTKVFEVRDPTDITEEWLLAKLAFFG